MTTQYTGSNRLPGIVGLAVGAALILAVTLFVGVAIAGHAEEKYCTPEFKGVLQRVIHACGLSGGESRRGCQPADVKTFASIDDKDFNALFTPLKDRGAVIMFDDAADKLDPLATKLL